MKGWEISGFRKGVGLHVEGVITIGDTPSSFTLHYIDLVSKSKQSMPKLF